jgi:hypothetical protein
MVAIYVNRTYHYPFQSFLTIFVYRPWITPKLTGASDSCSRRYPFERVYMEGKKQTISSESDEYLSMNDRHLKPHEIDKTVFESDRKFTRSYNGFILSNSKIKKKFKVLEDKLSQGHFNSGRKKGFQRWGKSKTICYIGSKGDAARIYYRFVPGEHKIEILAYSNKAKQIEITGRMTDLFDN